MVIGILITILILIVFSAIKWVESQVSSGQLRASFSKLTVNKTSPDSPVGFGYKCMWFAVKTNDKKRISEILKLKNVSDCNWQVGIDKAYKDSVFITPGIDGWTLACGWGLPAGDSEENIEEVKKILEALSKEFTEAHYFCTHRVTEYHCWMKATDGKVTRVYSYSGESGENLAVEGRPTAFEEKLNLLNTFSKEAEDEDYFEREDLTWADEELVMEVAAAWSIDPTTLEERNDVSKGLGLLGKR